MADERDLNDVPEALPLRRPRWPARLVWLIPLAAALIGGFLAVRAVLSHGPTVTIRFDTAEGLESGRTRIKYKSVDVGVVNSVTLAEDRAGILVRASMSKAAEPLLVEDTRFWIVRPRITAGAVTGLTTILSGSYIGMDAGTSEVSRREFEGLERPPAITSGLAGKEFVLRSEDIGSLDVGSPVYFRRLQAGQVVGYELEPGGKAVRLRVFVNAPYDAHVTVNTRFWHASGIDVALDANGLRIDTQSVATVLLGGVAFQAPDEPEALPAAEAARVFTLYENRAAAMGQPDVPPEIYALRFDESVRGLAIGAPVDFRGITVGEVRSIELRREAQPKAYPIVVEIALQPEKIVGRGGRARPDGRPALAPLIERGLRAQLRPANLLTGQQYVALDFFPRKAPVKLALNTQPPEIPVVGGSLQELQTTIASIAAKLDRVPLDEIGSDLRATLANANRVLARVDREIAPSAHDALQSANRTLEQFRDEIAPDARAAIADARKAMAALEAAAAQTGPLQQQANDTLRELERAARAFRLLADYLERHPEALIRGKREETQ